MYFVIRFALVLFSVISFTTPLYAEPGCIPGTVTRGDHWYSCDALPSASARGRSLRATNRLPIEVFLVKELPDLDELTSRSGKSIDLGFQVRNETKYTQDGKLTWKRYGKWVGYIGSNEWSRTICKGDIKRLLEIANLEKLPPAPAQFAGIPILDNPPGNWRKAIVVDRETWKTMSKVDKRKNMARCVNQVSFLQKAKASLDWMRIPGGWLVALICGLAVPVLIALTYLYRAVVGNSGRDSMAFGQLHAELEAMPENLTPNHMSSSQKNHAGPDTNGIQHRGNSRIQFGLRKN